MQRKITILVTIDDLRADAIGKFKNKELLRKYRPALKMPKTPTLDGLIGDGVFFDSCFTASTYTTASHAAIMTGNFPNRSGVQEYFKTKIGSKTIFESAKERLGADCSTVFYTDFPIILGKYLGFDRSVDHYFTRSEAQAIAAIKKDMARKDVLAFFHFSDVHTPYGFSGSKSDRAEFIKKTVALAEKYGVKTKGDKANSDWPEKKYDRQEMKFRKIYHEVIEVMYQRKEYAALMQLYLDGVGLFDKGRFADFIRQLKRSGIYSQATMVFFADHGERWWDDSHGHHDNLYDDTVRVPLVLIGQGLPKGKAVSKQVRTVDIAPTICKLWDIEPGHTDGQALLPLSSLKDRLAVGEIWTSQSVESIREFMHATVKNDALGDAKHHDAYLWKEYARDGKRKLINTYDGTGNKKTAHFKIRGGAELPVQGSREEFASLAKVLAAYRSNGSGDKKTASVRKTEQMKEYFNSLGYNV